MERFDKVKNSVKEKYVYSGYRITFDGNDDWSFGNDSARNVIILGVDNSSSYYSDNCKNNFLILGEGPTFGLNGRFGSTEKPFRINFTKANTQFCLSLHYNHDNNYLFVNGKKYLNIKLGIKISVFQLNFAWGVFLIDLVLLSQEKYCK